MEVWAGAISVSWAMDLPSAVICTQLVLSARIITVKVAGGLAAVECAVGSIGRSSTEWFVTETSGGAGAEDVIEAVSEEAGSAAGFAPAVEFAVDAALPVAADGAFVDSSEGARFGAIVAEGAETGFDETGFDETTVDGEGTLDEFFEVSLTLPAAPR